MGCTKTINMIKFKSNLRYISKLDGSLCGMNEMNKKYGIWYTTDASDKYTKVNYLNGSVSYFNSSF